MPLGKKKMKKKTTTKKENKKLIPKNKFNASAPLTDIEKARRDAKTKKDKKNGR